MISDWIETTATVSQCRSTLNLFSARNLNLGLASAPNYVITFFYEVNGQVFKGKFHDSTSYDEGDTFKISYDPFRPDKNTGADPPIRWTLLIIAIVSGLLIAWWTHRK